MSTASVPTTATVVYPETDGLPMAENTLQYQWIVTIKEGVEAIFADRPDVFVAGDLFWYPVKGDTAIVLAPDILVAIGRPKGHRPSYMQWEEGGIAPQVVFEILSPSNTPSEMAVKRAFYERHGVRESYEYDPRRNKLRGWVRRKGRLHDIKRMDGWTSGLLGVRFEMAGAELRLIGPDGQAFRTVQEIVRERNEAELRAKEERLGRLAERRRANAATRKAEQEKERAEQEKERAEQEKERAEQEKERADALAERLRALGIDPNSIA